MNLQSNDFELFGLPQRFAQERAAIDARWKALQREAHPDRFAAINKEILDLRIATLGEEAARVLSVEDGKRSPVELY